MRSSSTAAGSIPTLTQCRCDTQNSSRRRARAILVRMTLMNSDTAGQDACDGDRVRRHPDEGGRRLPAHPQRAGLLRSTLRLHCAVRRPPPHHTPCAVMPRQPTRNLYCSCKWPTLPLKHGGGCGGGGCRVLNTRFDRRLWSTVECELGRLFRGPGFNLSARKRVRATAAVPPPPTRAALRSCPPCSICFPCAAKQALLRTAPFQAETH